MPTRRRALTPTLGDVYRARERLRGKALRTPLVASPLLSGVYGGPVLLKLENQQLTGSFKIRGAFNAVAALSDGARRAGVVTVSTGNHGRAVAHACSEAGVRSVVCVSSLVPQNKLRAIEECGGELRIVGQGQDEASVEAARLAREEGLTLIPPFDNPEIISGQGTIGLEIAEEVSAMEDFEVAPLRLIVPLSGGGLIGGIALATRSILPDAEIVAVSSERCCAMHRSLLAGRPVQVEESESLADSLGGGIGEDNRYTFELARRLVDESLLVGDEDIAGAIRHAYRYERQIVEGAGAAGIAAILTGSVRAPVGGGAVVVVVSGANIDMDRHWQLVGGQAGKEEPSTSADDGAAGDSSGTVAATARVTGRSGGPGGSGEVPASDEGARRRWRRGEHLSGGGS